jgi:acyl-CoA oxidase
MPFNTLWKREFSEIIADLDDDLTSREAAECLRAVIGTGLVSVDDLRKEPEKFFEAHRMLAKQVHRIGAGFWIRFTLHYNLFAGAVLALGSSQQVKRFVTRNQVRPCLGCFALTEQQAANKDGLSVQTTAELSPDEKYFVINTPHGSAAKSWISQGLVADEAIVIATLVVHRHSYGPQAFLVKLRDERGHLLDGITLIDMGLKENLSDLDNARITFDHLMVPLSAHLCRYLEVKNGTVRHPLGKRIRTLDRIGQCLYTGRTVVAQAALAYTRNVLEQTHDMTAGNKICWAPMMSSKRGRDPRISPAVPHLSKGFMSHARFTLDSLGRFVNKVEMELCHCLRHDATPSERLQQAINVAKVEIVECSLELYSVLHGGSPAEDGHFLQCCKHVEGNSNVLMQKMARDLFQKAGDDGGMQRTLPVKAALDKLQSEMLEIQMGTGCQTTQAWDRCGELVYAVAEAHMDSVLQRYGCQLLRAADSSR